MIINKIAGTLLVLTLSLQVVFAQPVSEKKVVYSSPISRVWVLSVHVCDFAMHDSVFHFLTDKLGLPVEFYSEKYKNVYKNRRYAQVYAGNMFLEPCGPYTDIAYASKDFKAIFYGLNCESERAIPSLADDLRGRSFAIKQTSRVQVVDTAIIKQNVYFNISPQAAINKKHIDSLLMKMETNNKGNLGIERIKEIRVGYTDDYSLERWKDFIKPSILSKKGLWKINDDHSIRFIKSSIKEVDAIVFKVKSLKMAKKYLIDNNMMGDISKKEISLDKSKTFGLSILLSEE